MNKLIKIYFLLSLILTNNIIAIKQSNGTNTYQVYLNKKNREIEPVFPRPSQTLTITIAIIFIIWAITSLVPKISK